MPLFSAFDKIAKSRRYFSCRHMFIFICSSLFVLLSIPILIGNSQALESSSDNGYPEPGQNMIFLPVAAKNVLPGTPTLSPIINSDGNNSYSLAWTASSDALGYVLQESADAGFMTLATVYNGANLTWTTPNPGRTPNTYYYRVRAFNIVGDGNWSATQSVTIDPLFIGLNLKWDGVGYIRIDTSYDVGTHWTNNFDLLTDIDVGRSNNQFWYDPNPQGWTTDAWYDFYSLSTGTWLSGSIPQDSPWKWGYAWYRPYTFQFYNGQAVLIDGQPFIVSGPYSGYTAFGKAVQYWQLVNTGLLVYYDAGGDWKQYCHPGDIILHYDAGNTNLLLYDYIMRRYYYKGNLSPYTVNYVANLTFANSFPNMTAENLLNSNSKYAEPQQFAPNKVNSEQDHH
jgi:hypothetical protein